MTPSEKSPIANRRLDTWKEIGAFFGRDERTVKRWEITRGLPVHRIPGGGRANVYANTEELLAWLKGKNAAADPERIPNPVANSAALPRSESQRAEASVYADADSVERRVGQRRSVERNRASSPLWRDALFVVLALAIAAVLAMVIATRRNSSLHAARKGSAPAAPHIVDPEAKQFYLKGIFYFNKRTPETLNQAVDYFTQAVVRDPQYAEAYVGLADCYNLLREYTLMPPAEAYPRAIAAAKRAIALDDSLSGAHSSLAFAEFYWSWDIPSAQREFQRALALDPKAVIAHHWYATFLLHLGQIPDSLAEIEKAQQLDPDSKAILADKGLILFHSGQKEQAVALLKQIEATEPDFLSPHNYLATIYFAQGDYRQYFAESRKAATLLQDEKRLAIVSEAEKGLARGGQHGMLTAMLGEQRALQESGQGPAYNVAQTYAMLVNKIDSLDELETAYQKRESQLLSLRIDPLLNNLHDEPRYRELLAKIGMPPLQ